MFSHLCVVYFLMMLFAVTGSILPASAPSPVQGAQLLLVAVKLLSSSYKGYRSLIPNLFCERRTPTDQTQILITITPKLIANMWIYFLFSNYLSYCTILPTRNHSSNVYIGADLPSCDTHMLLQIMSGLALKQDSTGKYQFLSSGFVHFA